MSVRNLEKWYNTRYRAELFQVCHNGASQPLKPQDFFTGGASRAAVIENCLTRADFMSQAVFAVQHRYHTEAQNAQADYRKFGLKPRPFRTAFPDF